MNLIKMNENPIIHGLYIFITDLSGVIPDRPYLCIMYRLRTGKKLHLSNPQTFNEKIQCLKLKYKNRCYNKYTDKYEVRSYIADTVGKEYLIPLIGVYNSVEDINPEVLPQQFVVKCTHDSGSVVVCDSIDDLTANWKKLKRALKRKYYLAGRDYTYKGIVPRIVIEKKLENNGRGLRDYKFYCFNGVPGYLYISEGLEDHRTARISFYNIDYTVAPFCRKDYLPLEYIPDRPERYEEMLEIAKKLSKGIEFVRIDLYEVDGHIYFSEMTFAPCGGYMPFMPEYYDKVLGKMLELG